MSSLLVALIAVLVTVASACSRSNGAGRKVIVLGFDGMDYQVTRELMAKGRMPHFAKIGRAHV